MDNLYLKITNVTKTYGKVRANKQITLDILKGEFFFIIGPSGCGKTTLLKIIGGLVASDGGSLVLKEQCLNSMPPYHRNINTVFQNYALFPHLTVFDNVAFGLKMKGTSKNDTKKKVKEILKLVELEGFELRKSHQLSGGQQQRVALARALVNQPAVLLLDEPLGALDVKLRKQMQLELKHLQKKLGMTFVYVTHDQEEALSMADRIAVMNAGRIEQVGTPDEIYNKPKTRFVAKFIGESNFFENAHINYEQNDVHLQIDEQYSIRAKLSEEYAKTDKLTLAVRPEKIKINKEPSSTSEFHNVVKGQIDEIIYGGTMLSYLVRLSSSQMVKVLEQSYNNHVSYDQGDMVYLIWDVENTIAIKEPT